MYKENDYIVDDFVTVTNNGRSYTTYEDDRLPKELMSRYVRRVVPKNGTVVKIVYITSHTHFKNTSIYIVENVLSKDVYILDSEGIEKFTISRYV